MTSHIREKINKLNDHLAHNNRQIRVILEEICNELDKLEATCSDNSPYQPQPRSPQR